MGEGVLLVNDNASGLRKTIARDLIVSIIFGQADCAPKL